MYNLEYDIAIFKYHQLLKYKLNVKKTRLMTIQKSFGPVWCVETESETKNKSI